MKDGDPFPIAMTAPPGAREGLRRSSTQALGRVRPYVGILTGLATLALRLLSPHVGWQMENEMGLRSLGTPEGHSIALLPLIQGLRNREAWRRSREMLQLENRRRVYDYIKANPGVHVRALKRDLGMGMGNLSHHLGLLEEAGLVVSQRRGRGLKAYFSWDVTPQDRLPLALLRDPMNRAILEHLQQFQEVDLEGVKRILGVSKSTAWAHLQRLVEAGLVAKLRASGPEAYFLPNPGACNSLLRAAQGRVPGPEVVGSPAPSAAADRL